MTPSMVGKDAGTARAGEYAQHRPEQTLLYQLIEAHYPAFVEHLAARERTLPAHVVREFEDYLLQDLVGEVLGGAGTGIAGRCGGGDHWRETHGLDRRFRENSCSWSRLGFVDGAGLGFISSQVRSLCLP